MTPRERAPPAACLYLPLLTATCCSLLATRLPLCVSAVEQTATKVVSTAGKRWICGRYEPVRVARGVREGVRRCGRAGWRDVTSTPPRSDQRLPNRVLGTAVRRVLRSCGGASVPVVRCASAVPACAVGLRLSEPRRAPWCRGAAASEHHEPVPVALIRARPDGRPGPGYGVAVPPLRSGRPSRRAPRVRPWGRA